MKFALLALVPAVLASAAVAAGDFSADTPSDALKYAADSTAENLQDAIGQASEPLKVVTNAAQSMQRRRNKKHHKSVAKSAGSTFKAVTNSLPTGQEEYPDKVHVTWYGAHDLLNPSCGDGSWNPTDSSFIGAIGQWEGGPKCGDMLNICRTKGGKKCIMIRVVDSCAACKSQHIDLTRQAFLQLAGDGGLDEGVVSDLSLYKAGMPKPFDSDLFGPLKLKG